MSRAEKAAYILEGISINRNDMDYYFYQTRVDAITRFIKESTEKAEKINPEIVISAAVFINPMRSARHTGQKWTDFVRWIDILAPMNYRSHFQGSFKAYLDYLSEYVQAQKKWCGGESLVYAGITGHYIYREEREHWEKAVKILSSKEAESRESEFRLVMAEIIPRLERVAPKRAKGLDVKYSSYLRKTIEKEVLLEEIKNILTDPPVNLFPRKKLLQTIQAVKTAGADGISFFSAGILSRNKLWPALERIFVKKR
jgi:hypothetical protein